MRVNRKYNRARSSVQKCYVMARHDARYDARLWTETDDIAILPQTERFRRRYALRPIGLRNLPPKHVPRNCVPIDDSPVCGNVNVSQSDRPRWHGPERNAGCAAQYVNDDAPWMILLPILERDTAPEFHEFLDEPAQQWWAALRAMAFRLQSIYHVDANDILNEFICLQFGGHNPPNDSALLAKHFKNHKRSRASQSGRKTEAGRRAKISAANFRKRARIAEETAIVHSLRGRSFEQKTRSIEECAALLSRRARLSVRVRVSPKTMNATCAALKNEGYDKAFVQTISRSRRETVESRFQFAPDGLENEISAPRGEKFVGAEVTRDFLESSALANDVRAVAKMLSEGKSRSEVAQTLGVCEGTVSRTIAKIRSALKNRIEEALSN